MKTSKIFTIAALLALVAAGCTKEGTREIRLLRKPMTLGGAKVLVDPMAPSNATWIASETVDLNGTTCTIAGNATVGFRLDNVTPLNEAMYALYPGSSFGGNDVTVTNNSTTREVVMNRLTVRFTGDGKHETVFPMAASAEAGEGSLLFNHLTGGFCITLKNTSASPVDVATLKVVAQSASTVAHLGNGTYSARWAVQGPTTPSGGIGIDGDVAVGYSSEMVFDLRSGSNAYATVAGNNGTLSFCVPVTISSVRYLTFVGYSTSGSEIFRIHKDLCSTGQSEVAIVLNRMYTIPTININ